MGERKEMDAFKVCFIDEKEEEEEEEKERMKREETSSKMVFSAEELGTCTVFLEASGDHDSFWQ